MRSYRFLKWHCSIKPYIILYYIILYYIILYYIIYDSLGHILLSYIWILSVIIRLKVPSHHLIKFTLFLDCLLLKLGVGGEYCCLGVHLQKLILSFHPNSFIIVLADRREPISVNS